LKNLKKWREYKMVKKTLELTKGEAQVIEGEFINIKQSTVRAVEGGHVELQQVGALTIDGERIDATQGAACIIRGRELSLNQSISAVSIADEASLNFSFSPISMAKNNTDVNRSAVGIMVSKEIKSENSSSLIMIAKKVEGKVTTLLDWKSALAFGAVIGGILGLAKLLIKEE
jgi:hypothetical protein